MVRWGGGGNQRLESSLSKATQGTGVEGKPGDFSAGSLLRKVLSLYCLWCQWGHRKRGHSQKETARFREAASKMTS